MAPYCQWLVKFHFHRVTFKPSTNDLPVPCVTLEHVGRKRQRTEVQHVPDDSATTQKTQQAKYVHSSTLLLLLSHDSHTHALDSSEPARGTSTIQIMSSDFSPPASPDSKNGHHHHAASDANIRNFAPVARIMKTALPDNAKIAKEAKECMQECVSEFISFITSEGMC